MHGKERLKKHLPGQKKRKDHWYECVGTANCWMGFVGEGGGRGLKEFGTAKC